MNLAKPSLFFLFAVSASHGAYVISQPNNNATFGNAATGQSFTPAQGMVDNPGANTATIDLTSFSFWSNGGASAGPSGSPASNLDTVYLHIYDANPSGSGANLVGVSTNSRDLNPASNFPQGTEISWTFNNLTLNYQTTYFAVFSKGTTRTNVNDVGIGLQVDNNNPYSGGTGLTNDFAVAATQDAKFSATFANPVPEPAVTLLGSIGLLGLLRRRRH
ncbi:MAG: hypothetical protein RLZ97_1925 [Verrucomicrobiota bacterium]|jgi:hypothetical protein